MVDKNKDEDNIYDDIAEVADFIHDRLGTDEPIGLNNTVEEYMKDDEGKE